MVYTMYILIHRRISLALDYPGTYPGTYHRALNRALNRALKSEKILVKVPVYSSILHQYSWFIALY